MTNDLIIKEKLLNLYEQILLKYKSLLNPLPRHQRISHDNLISYLALQQQNLKELDRLLVEEGFISLKEASPHLLFSIKKILNYLEYDLTELNDVKIATPNYVKSIRLNRSEKIFGPRIEGLHSNIMVTLDSKIVERSEMVEELLRNGVNIIRINCAHESEDSWETIIRTLRAAEKRLKERGHYPNRRCRVYMDLAGPKVRIGNLEKQRIPLKITVSNKNALESQQTIGYLDGNAPSTKRLNDNSFVLAVKDVSIFPKLKEGDEIKFNDIRNRMRVLKVIEWINQTCVKVSLHKNSIIDENTLFHHTSGDFTVHSFLADEVEIKVVKGDQLHLYLDPSKIGHPSIGDRPAGVPVTLTKAFRNVRMGDPIFIDDGKIKGTVDSISKNEMIIKILTPSLEPARIKEGKGINLPDSLLSLNLPALTEKDIRDLAFISKHADIVGISFVHSPVDLMKLRQELEIHSAGTMPVVAKIETKDAINHLARIIMEGLKFESFGVMIARGDLAVEVGYEHLANVQEEILSICSAAHIPVIWATGILEKLSKKEIPSRPEITDAYYGLRADCIMLNKGPYIVESVKFLSNMMKGPKTSSLPMETYKRSLTQQYGIFKHSP